MLGLKSRKKETPEVQREGELMLAHANSAARHNGRNIRLLIAREYVARVRKRSFVIATIAIAVFIVIGTFAPIVITLLSGNSQTKIAVVNNGGTVSGQSIVSSLDSVLNQNNAITNQTNKGQTSTKKAFDIRNEQAANTDTLKQQVRDGKLDGVLTVGRGASGDLTFDYYSSASSTGVQVNQVESAAAQVNFTDKLARAGVAESQLASLYTPPSFKATSTEDEKSGRTPSEALAAYLVAFAGIILIYMSIIQYGVMVAQGTVEEKSSRVMEIMINAATPFQLLAGKIVGIGLAGLTQMLAVILAGAVSVLIQIPLRSALFSGTSASDALPLDITSLSTPMLGALAIYFVLGFLLYAGLFAALGSLNSRQEDVQASIGPMTLILVVVYLSSIFSLQTPDANWVVILSYVPFFSPMLMLTRIGVGSVSWWEIPITIVIMAASVLIAFVIAARIYRAGVLMYGQKVSMGKLVKLVFSR